MIAMLLAAGRGERMRPLTDTTAKPLLKAGGRQLIDYHLESLALAGVDTVVINTCWQAEKIVAQLGRERYGLKIIYSYEPVALETAGGIVNALALLGDEPFLLVSADVWGQLPFQSLRLPEGDQGHLLLVPNPPHHPDGDFCLDHTRITVATGARLTYSGVGVFHPQAFRHLAAGFRPLRQVLQQLMEEELLSGSIHRGVWFDIGTPQRLAELDAYLRAAE